MLADDCVELWVVYEGETALGVDPRNPKRKLAWSGAHHEVLFVALPTACKGQRQVVARDVFTELGASTNYSRTYTGVSPRTLAEIPRLTVDDKNTILGSDAVGAFAKERVAKDMDAKGHPLFWGEWKPVMLFNILYKDFEITDVWDMSVGVGAAAILVFYSKVHDFGVCFNDAHRKWVHRLIQQCFTTLVADGHTAVDDAVVKRVQQYFHRAVSTARQWLPSDETKPSVAGAADDSDLEE